MTTDVREVDVLVVGAGLSGIGVARHLVVDRPGTTFVVLEARDAIGGTWDLFRYPGIRSDSDLHTFGYEFKPWTDDDAIADGPRILDYLHEVVAEHDLARHVRLGHRVVAADFDADAARWAVTVEVDGGELQEWSARWLFSAGGYYRYDRGHSPDFPGLEQFTGRVVHPQVWPDDLDVSGQQVVIIGSGATAITLVPALATGPTAAAHVTMLQRTPTYVMPLPRRDRLANAARRVLPERAAYALTRTKNIAKGQWVWNLSRSRPQVLRRVIRAAMAKQLPEGYDLDTHFNPPYDPWDQRLCADPDGHFFRAIRDGRASVVTDTVESFTPHGIRLASGRELPAALVVTATGLEVQLMGGIDLSVDGKPVHWPDHVVYRGLMVSGVPNFAFAMGYTNQSWTLRLSLVCDWFTRLLAHMEAEGLDGAVPEWDPGAETAPALDFQAGYVQRAAADLPRQGVEAPWKVSMDYYADRRQLRRGPLLDDALTLWRGSRRVS
ncbi:NAD(P)/FAD-dependent oxidoreductase [Nocardioides sp. Y6]|uniref:NAD(P)/FAD-dependent oxidoreductase n=1 Tax=Nocardioides malaquae TaxID=2773426 RepID=A0ABR9RUJ2_9ACTN|nr:NAD(P)/FAD-dependent oxidoreductase [Nocardioides malaquae]MBE7325228.1 NAD(P)/FAD-dependent oxidoreductase [Nocardioides malaquae]